MIFFITALKSSSKSLYDFVTLSFSKITSDWKMSLELLEYLVTRQRVARVSMEIFKSDDSIKEDGSFLCDGEFGLNCGVASDKGICIP